MRGKWRPLQAVDDLARSSSEELFVEKTWRALNRVPLAAARASKAMWFVDIAGCARDQPKEAEERAAAPRPLSRLFMNRAHIAGPRNRSAPWVSRRNGELVVAKRVRGLRAEHRRTSARSQTPIAMLKQLQMGMRAFLLMASRVWTCVCFLLKKQVRSVSRCYRVRALLVYPRSLPSPSLFFLQKFFPTRHLTLFVYTFLFVYSFLFDYSCNSLHAYCLVFV